MTLFYHLLPGDLGGPVISQLLRIPQLDIFLVRLEPILRIRRIVLPAPHAAVVRLRRGAARVEGLQEVRVVVVVAGNVVHVRGDVERHEHLLQLLNVDRVEAASGPRSVT